jgi:RNA polymerase sigma factor, sigma-70 family
MNNRIRDIKTAGKKEPGKMPRRRRTLGLAKTKPGNIPYQSMSDIELVIASQRGDELAMTHLLKMQERSILNILRSIAPDFRDTADLVQEALIRLWSGIPHLRNPYSFRTWMTRIVKNLFYDELRNRPRDIQIVSTDDLRENSDNKEQTINEIVDDSTKPDNIVLSNELAELISDAIEKVPPQFRAVVLLRDVDGLSYDQIAEATHTDIGTVKSRISRGRAKIQRYLRSYLEVA